MIEEGKSDDQSVYLRRWFLPHVDRLGRGQRKTEKSVRFGSRRASIKRKKQTMIRRK